MVATKWFFINQEVKILHTIDIFDFVKVKNVSDGKVYYVDKAFLKTFPRESEKAISITLLGGINSGYNATKKLSCLLRQSRSTRSDPLAKVKRNGQ